MHIAQAKHRRSPDTSDATDPIWCAVEIDRTKLVRAPLIDQRPASAKLTPLTTLDKARMTDRYALIGNPVAHSKSPLIHAAFAKQTEQDMRYEALLCARDDFVATIARLRDQGFSGLNVTVPFKLEAFAYASTHSERASRCGAVNTLRFAASEIFGDNTDGVGLIRDMEQNLSNPLQNKRVLLLGAGGAARGVLGEIVAAKPACVVIANRSMARAEQLASLFAASGSSGARSLHELGDEQFDVVINATSIGLGDAALAIPRNCFAVGALAVDMVYSRDTAFLELARACGARARDGLGMLVEQAAEAFYLWRGVRPSTAPVLEWLRGPQ